MKKRIENKMMSEVSISLAKVCEMIAAEIPQKYKKDRKRKESVLRRARKFRGMAEIFKGGI